MLFRDWVDGRVIVPVEFAVGKNFVIENAILDGRLRLL
jgi:hypothetical protein